MAQQDFLLSLESVQGESEQTGFKGYSDIESWSWGAMNSGSAAQGGGLGTGKVSMQDFHFVIKNGRASAELFLRCASGKHIPKAELVCRKSDGNNATGTYYKVTFTDCLVSSFQEGGSGGSDLMPMCQISINFSKVEVEYYEQKTVGGTFTTTGAKWYDQKIGKSNAT